MKKFSLLFTAALLCIGLFSALMMVSCAEEIPVLEEQNLEEFERQFVLPKGLDLEDEALFTFLQEADEDLLSKLEQNANLIHFLAQENLFYKVFKTMNDGDHFADLDLTNHLSKEQMLQFDNFMFSGQLKGSTYSCRYIAKWGPCRYYRCCYYEYPVCWTKSYC